ncbi:hypothetical protein GCM10010504_19170 [Streptomyces griseus]|nr:hypothetical protein GCM10010504_19170 [Streptomyces griseus]
MVGDDEFAAGGGFRRVPPDRDAYAEGPGNRPRPAPYQPLPAGGPEQPDQRHAGHPEQDQGAAGQQQERGGQRGAYGSRVPGTAVRGARGDGQPGAHASGARERKWRR